MSRPCCLQRQTSRHRGTALAALVAAVLVASPAAAMTRAAASPVEAANAAQLCALVIQINTKYGTMKNKRFLPVDSISANQWKGLVDAAVAQRSHVLAVAPSSIKKALAHELAYFAHIKANHYAKATPLAPWTTAEVTQIGTFERMKCGIKF